MAKTNLSKGGFFLGVGQNGELMKCLSTSSFYLIEHHVSRISLLSPFLPVLYIKINNTHRESLGYIKY